jgi:HSP20 family protein
MSKCQTLDTATDESFKHLTRQMGKALENMHRSFYSFYGTETWAPAVNLYETEKFYIVCVDLAGVEQDKIQVGVHEGILVIRGNRSVPSDSGTEATGNPKRMKVHLMEIDHGQFRREVELPANAQKSGIVARFNEGLLWIEIPKA